MYEALEVSLSALPWPIDVDGGKGKSACSGPISGYKNAKILVLEFPLNASYLLVLSSSNYHEKEKIKLRPLYINPSMSKPPTYILSGT